MRKVRYRRQFFFLFLLPLQKEIELLVNYAGVGGRWVGEEKGKRRKICRRL